jgi:hypothetical protein
MAEKIRLVLVVDEEIRATLRLEAGKRSAARRDGSEVTMAEVLEDLVREGLGHSLEEVRRARASEEKRKGHKS